jgi:hypothetical protein
VNIFTTLSCLFDPNCGRDVAALTAMTQLPCKDGALGYSCLIQLLPGPAFTGRFHEDSLGILVDDSPEGGNAAHVHAAVRLKVSCYKSAASLGVACIFGDMSWLKTCMRRS